jgi:hypothetical protein
MGALLEVEDGQSEEELCNMGNLFLWFMELLVN